MSKRHIFSLVSLVAMVVLAFGASFAAAADDAQIQLSFRIPENQTLVYESVTNTTMDLGAALGFSMVQTIEQREVFSLEFGATQADETTPFTFRTLEVFLDGEDLRELFGGPDPDIFIEYTGLMNADGSIAAIDFPQATPGLEDLGIDFNQLMQNLAVPFPDYPLAAGDGWEISQEVPLGELAGVNFVDFVINASYTLLDFDAAADTATLETSMQGYVEAEMQISSDDDPSLPEGMIMTMTMAIEMEGEGTSVTEMSTGQLVSLKFTMLQLMDIQMAIPGLPEVGDTMTMPMMMEMELRRID